MTGQSAGRFRVYVHYLSKRALLAIDKVVENDEGTYHCRVDYRWSGTTRKKFRMELIGLFISALSQPGNFLIMHLLLLPLSLSLFFSLSLSLSFFVVSSPTGANGNSGLDKLSQGHQHQQQERHHWTVCGGEQLCGTCLCRYRR